MIRTATGKEQALVDFYAQLERDGLNCTILAERARVGRAYLTRVFNGHVSGCNTWKHVVPYLSERAVFCLKQCSAWNIYAQHAWRDEWNERQAKLPVSQS